MSSEDAPTTPVTDLSAVMEAVEALKKSLEEQRKGQVSLFQQVAVLQQEKSVSSQPPVSESGKSRVQLV